MKAFLTTFFATLLAIFVSAGVYFVAGRFQKKRAVIQVSAEEAYARQLMKGLSPDDVISACGEPQLDHLAAYGDHRWRILTYKNYEANFLLKEGRWQYDFSSDGNGRMLPDADMVRRPVSIKLPCQP